ncbi:MAG: phosphopantetheine-binding protein [Paracoccaceae bacterium]
MLGEPQEGAVNAGFAREVAEMIVDALALEDVTADEIDPKAPLFGDGLGLDSIDALEISFAIAQRYGIKLRSDDARNAEIFASLNALTGFIAENRSK